MKLRRINVLTCVVGLLAGSTLAASGVSTEARVPINSSLAVNPCPNVGPLSRHDGAETSRQNAIWGSRSDIEYDTPAICGSDAIFSIAWAMVNGRNTNCGDVGWAQTGYGNFASEAFPVHTGYWEWGQTWTGCANLENYWRNHPSGATKTYNAQYKSGDGHLHLIIDGDQFGETGWNPTNLWAGDWQSEFFGETKFAQSDVPGTVGDPVAFLNNEKLVRDVSGDFHWAKIHDLDRISPTCRYRFDFLNPDDNQNFRIWTQPLDSLC